MMARSAGRYPVRFPQRGNQESAHARGLLSLSINASGSAPASRSRATISALAGPCPRAAACRGTH